jgi:activator of Hsp90 ATPase-like protein
VSTGFGPIRETVTVRLEPVNAFALFTEGMGTWWPLEDYSRAFAELSGTGVIATGLDFEPRLGGVITELLSDGQALPWAEVTLWEPPNRVVMDWHPHAQPEPPTELDVTFAARGDRSLVMVEHRGWERLSPAFRDALYEVYVRGWVTTLRWFAETADRGARD